MMTTLNFQTYFRAIVTVPNGYNGATITGAIFWDRSQWLFVYSSGWHPVSPSYVSKALDGWTN